MPPDHPDLGPDFDAQRPPDEPTMPPELQGPDASPADLRPIYDRLQADAHTWSATVASDAPLAGYIRSLPRRFPWDVEEFADMNILPEYPGSNSGSRPTSFGRSDPPGGGFPRGRTLPAIAAAVLIVALLGGALYALGVGRGTGTSPSATPTTTSPQPTDTPQPAATATPSPRPTSTPNLYAISDGIVYALNTRDGTVRWQQKLTGAYSLAAANGVVYTPTSGSSARLYALGASDGATLWSVAIPNGGGAQSVAAAGDMVYVGFPASSGSAGGVWAFAAADGKLRWQYSSANCSFTSLVADATAVYTDAAGCGVTLTALRASDGHALWQWQVGTGGATPALAGNVLYVNEYGDVYAVDASNGVPIWHKQTGSTSNNSFALVANGIVYAVVDFSVYALRAGDGSQVWRSGVGGNLLEPSLAADGGALYAVDTRGSAYAMRAADGSIAWTIKPASGGYVRQAARDGIVYLDSASIGGVSPSSIVAVRASDGTALWQRQVGVGVYALALAP